LYKIESVEIDGFWQQFNAQCNFNPNVNIIIGRNGTGKTTFMNILHAVLTADVTELAENDFESVIILLSKEQDKHTIQVQKIEDDPYPVAEYEISGQKKQFRLRSTEDRRIPYTLRRKLLEESLDIRNKLGALVSVASLSVYRLRNDDEYEVKDRYGSRIISPVDYRLSQALQGLTQFQLELAQQASGISERLQADVLASILYGEEDATDSANPSNFDRDEEREKLISAYKQLNSFNEGIDEKINFHVNSIDNVIQKIGEDESLPQKSSHQAIDIKPLEALRKTRRIIDLSLEAKEKTQEIYSQLELFLKIIKEFIFDKEFKFNSGKLVISNDSGQIDHIRLSSGEKQLIILLVEALLQNQHPHIFLADEPELSLHVAWQREIIPAVRQINPNAQVIVATHSPEVASKYRDFIFDMEELVHV
jgi:ABC-type lipoprotein export system ATPase subunit